MNRINKILVIFLILMGVSIFASWRLLQSPMFAEVLTNYLNERFITKIDANIKIGQVKFTMFPPSTHLYDVTAHKDELFSSRFKSLSLIFSPWDFFRSDIKVSKIEVRNGYADLIVKDSKKETNEVVNPFVEFSKVVKSLPFKFGELQIDDTYLLIKEKYINIDSLSLRPFKRSIELDLAIENFSHGDIKLDSINTSVEFMPKKVRVKTLNVLKNETVVKSFGEVLFSKSYEYNLQLEYLGKLVEVIPADIQKEYGLSAECECLINVKGKDLNPKVEVRGELKNVKTIYANAESVNFVSKFEGEELLIEKGEVFQNGGKATLNKFIKINVKDFKSISIDATAKDLHSHDFLYFLGEDFNILKTRVSGGVKLFISKNLIKISGGDNLVANNLAVGLKEDLLNIKKIEVDEIEFNIGKNVLFKLDGKSDESKISAEGLINDKGLNITSNVSDFNMKSLNGILGKSTSGFGNYAISVSGSFEKAKLDVSSKGVSELAILDYQLLEKTDASIEYHFSTNKLVLAEVASYGTGILNGTGFVDFENNKMDINISSRKAQFKNMDKSLAPIWKDVKPYLGILDGEFAGEFSIFGEFSDLKIKGKAFSKIVSLYNESFDSLEGSFLVDQQKLNVSNMRLKKAKSSIDGSIVVDFDQGLKSSTLNIYEYKLSNSDYYRQLGLGYDGVFNARVSLKNEKGIVLNGQASMLRSYVGRKQIKPSNIIFNYEKDRLSLATVLLGGKGSMSAEVYMNSKASKVSTVKANANIEDLRTIFGILSLHNVYDSDLDGKLVGSFRSDFKVSDLKTLNVSANLSKFHITKLNKTLRLARPGFIDINKSKINRIDVNVGGSGGFYKLSGSGELFKSARVEQEFNIDLNFAHVLSPFFERLSGAIKGKGVITGNVKNYNNFHKLNGENLFVKIKNVPVSIQNGSFNSVLENKNWSLNNIDADIGEGKLTGDAKVIGSLPFPTVEGRLNFSEVNYPFGNSSNINSSGVLKFTGNKFPYELSGNLLVNNGRILDDFTELSGGSNYVKSVDKYIGVEKRGIPDIVTLNVQAKIKDSIRVKNRLSDLFIMGGVDVVGNPLAPAFQGRLSVIPSLSKFRFKGNEFYVTEGLIDFSSKNTGSPIVLKFSSEAKVAQYDVKMDVVGGVEDLKINLESNPALNTDDIFSLLTLGVTRSYSESLEEKDRQSLTTIGLGTLLVDQLQINEGLDSTLGLKLSLLPEVSENDDTPIQSSGSEQVNKVKTATKVKIQKKVTENVDLTYSNTFGGDGDRVQEMNVDFNLNENFSIQGVFENTENNNEEEKENSVGADIKYKWTF